MDQKLLAVTNRINLLDEDITRYGKYEPVYFSATTDGVPSPIKTGNIIFKTAKQKSDDSYNEQLGLFKCQTPGIYSFQFMLLQYYTYTRHSTAYLTLNGANICKGIAYTKGNPNFRLNFGCGASLRLKKDDEVYVHLTGQAFGGSYASFSGVLIVPTY